jgi:tRNA-specific 2-thiouridylase
MESRLKVVIAMSGGVDSSVAAALLVKQGYDVIGIMLRLWSEPGKQAYNRCCTPDAMSSARRVAAKLDIPFYAVDAQEIFFSKVVNYFVEGYIQGITPNPCLICNRQIRWEYLLNHAHALGADALATGHYARLGRDSQGRIQLLRGVDANKDQSYVLHVLGQEQLAYTLFPLGKYTKPQVRLIASEFNIPGAERDESQDLCFLGNEDYRGFLTRYAREQVERPGLIVNRAGQEIGHHRGLPFYTIGQRKGLGIASAQPLYVLEKDWQKNLLVVGSKDEQGQRELVAKGVNWISGEIPEDRIRAQVKIRYKAKEVWADITPMEDNRVFVRFDDLMRDITPGQAVVFYQDDVCLGGGVIEKAFTGKD